MNSLQSATKNSKFLLLIMKVPLSNACSLTLPFLSFFDGERARRDLDKNSFESNLGVCLANRFHNNCIVPSKAMWSDFIYFNQEIVMRYIHPIKIAGPPRTMTYNSQILLYLMV